MGFAKTFRRFCLSVFFFLCILGLAALVSLLYFEHRVPRFILDRAVQHLSTDDYLVTVERATVRLTRGAKLHSLRVLDRKKPTARPVLSCSKADLDWSFTHLLRSRTLKITHVTVSDLSYPRLPDGYYTPDSIEFPGQPDFKERNEPVVFSLPTIEPFSLTLLSPRILGLTPARVICPSVSARPQRLQAEDVQVVWPDADTNMTITGRCTLDLERQLVDGFVRGQARQHNIRPLLVALDITNSYAFIDAFTRVQQPVDAACAFTVNLRNSDLHLNLDLHPHGGRYNNIPLVDTHGKLDIRVFVRDTFQNAHITIGPLETTLADGRTMAGTIFYENTNDVGYVNFDVRSTTSLSNALAIADVLNDGTLDCLSFNEQPSVTLTGRLAVDPGHAAANDLNGSVAFASGALFGIPLFGARARFAVKGTDVLFTDCRATARHGGTLTGSGKIAIPGFTGENASFNVTVNAEKIQLKDLADVFSLDLGDRHGTVSGQVTLSGPLETNLTARLSGRGHLSCQDGHLAQMNLFAGLTKFLADKIPGFSSFVNQSRCSLDFTLEKGLFRTDNLVIEGDFFSILAQGTYDICADKLAFSAKMTLTKNDGFFATLTTPLTWPFAHLTRMLFDFTIYGPLENPDWSYNKDFSTRLK